MMDDDLDLTIELMHPSPPSPLTFMLTCRFFTMQVLLTRQAAEGEEDLEIHIIIMRVSSSLLKGLTTISTRGRVTTTTSSSLPVLRSLSTAANAPVAKKPTGGKICVQEMLDDDDE